MFTALITLTLFVTVTFGCDSIEKGWKSILPLQSDRQFVESNLGKPTAVMGEISEYSMDDAFVRVTYSRNRCSGESRKRSYDVPDDTVVEYTVNYRSKLDISNVTFDQNAFTKDKSSDLVNSYNLVNFDAGIMVGVFVINDRNLVSDVWYWPSKQDSKRLSCSK